MSQSGPTAIAAVQTHTHDVPLSRPYTIATRQVNAITMGVVAIRDGAGRVGLGSASPAPHVTGETVVACVAALASDRLGWLCGRDVRTLPALLRELDRHTPHLPAARAAVDMALHDLFAQQIGLPLCDLLGRVGDGFLTSITIGIKPVDEALREADEYLGRGFRVLKVKIGLGLEEDLERLTRLRDHVGPDVVLRVDANQGYTRAETVRLLAARAALNLEMVEQPVPAAALQSLADLPAGDRLFLAADESLHGPADALTLAARPQPVGIFNIKLMKCGGIAPARRIADIAETAGLALMWGCMDESRIAIAAALHLACASPATRYLDLDGSLDLAHDVAEGGFSLVQGRLAPLPRPGLGVTLS